MPPRGRPRSKKNTRISAAIEALIPMGFAEPTIRQTVTDLLKIYDGEWIFIEEGSYKLLIETLLEKQEKESLEMIEADGTHNHAEPSVALTVNEADALNSVTFAGGVRSSNEMSIVPIRDSIGDRVHGKLAYHSTHQRKPCYGWIAESSDEEDDIIHLPTASSGKCQPNQNVGGMKRKSRWDIGPGCW